MNLSPELERKCLILAGVAGARLTEPRPGEPDTPKLVAPAFIAPNVWVLPIETCSEINGRDWKARSGRTQKAKRAVSVHLGRHLGVLKNFAAHYHSGLPVTARFFRLGTRKIDAANLGTALKATEDAVAFMMGVDDGDARWVATFDQEIGPLMGVRIELELRPLYTTLG